MNTSLEPIRKTPASAAVAAAAPPMPSHQIRILFRRVGFHHHCAVVNGRTFHCTRQCDPKKTPVRIRWSAFVDDTLLKVDCPTLNEAKNVCRAAVVAAAQGGRPGQDAAQGRDDA